MLEQEALTLGLGESTLAPSGIGSPQHLQIRGFMDIAVRQCQCLASRHRFASGRDYRQPQMRLHRQWSGLWRRRTVSGAPASPVDPSLRSTQANYLYRFSSNTRMMLAAVLTKHYAIPSPNL